MRAAVALVAGLAVLAGGAAQAGRAAYPGKNGLIAFVRGGDIWTIHADGTGLTRLTRTAVKEAHPAWSRSGTKLAFDSDGHIFVMDANGSNRVDLTAVEADTTFGVCDSDPTWAPNAKQIAFSSITSECSGEAGEIDAMKPDGTGRRSRSPDWQPLP